MLKGDRTLLTCTSSGVISVWNTETGAILYSIPIDNEEDYACEPFLENIFFLGLGFCVSPDEKMVFSYGECGAFLVDLEKRKRIWKLGDSFVAGAAFHPSGKVKLITLRFCMNYY